MQFYFMIFYFLKLQLYAGPNPKLCISLEQNHNTKNFGKTWSSHFVPFIHVKRGQNVATKFCQKFLYYDSTLVPLQFFHKFQSKVWFYSEMYFTIKKRIFAPFWYQNIYVSNFTKLFRQKGSIQRHFLSYRTNRRQVNLPFTQTQISCVTCFSKPM